MRFQLEENEANIFAHTSIFVLFSPVHSNVFSFGKVYFLMRLCLVFACDGRHENARKR